MVFNPDGTIGNNPRNAVFVSGFLYVLPKGEVAEEAHQNRLTAQTPSSPGKKVK
jgi:hypothetical protein